MPTPLWNTNTARRTRDLSTLYGLLVGLGLLLMVGGIVNMCGCSTFTRPDGSTVIAPSPSKLETAAAATSTSAGIFGGPIGQAAGAGLASVLLALATYYRGKEKGWDEKADDSAATPDPTPQSKLRP